MEKQSNTVSWIRGKCIGKGSFGTVNIAFSKSNCAVFAVKSIGPNACTANQVESLENEIRILRSLSSTHVVKFLGDDISYEPPSSCSSSSTAPHRNLHMEYLPGGTVADVAYRDLDEKFVRSYTWCVVSALRYVHSRGIVHCDVKGKNILVGPNPGSAKLADFGSAVEISGHGTCRASIFPRGSPLWMAPEVIRGVYQGPESDVWSLGCTVIEMVTGKSAWEDQGIDTLSRIGFSNELPELPNHLSELGRDFVGKCLRRDPRERWSCDQLLQHPFISSASPNAITESSPRCVLDWLNTDFEGEENDDDDDDNDVVSELASSTNFESTIISAKQRIGKLATESGTNWEESDGWTPVRSSHPLEPKEEEEETGTNSSYVDLIRIEEETAATISGHSSDSVGIGEGRTGGEFLNSGGSELLGGHVKGSTCGLCLCVCGDMSGAGWRCGCVSQKVELAVGRRELVVGSYHTFCNLLPLLLHFFSIFRYSTAYILCYLLLLPLFVHVTVSVSPLPCFRVQTLSNSGILTG